MAKCYEFNITWYAARMAKDSKKHMTPRNLKIAKLRKIRNGIKISFNWWTWAVQLIISFNKKTLESNKLSKFLKSLESISAGTGY
jgi:hypothetical protein